MPIPVEVRIIYIVISLELKITFEEIYLLRFSLKKRLSITSVKDRLEITAVSRAFVTVPQLAAISHNLILNEGKDVFDLFFPRLEKEVFARERGDELRSRVRWWRWPDIFLHRSSCMLDRVAVVTVCSPRNA